MPAPHGAGFLDPAKEQPFMSTTPVTAPDPATAPHGATEATAPETAPNESKPDTTDWKAEARKWENRAKDNKTAAEELASLKAAQMTEAEKAAAALTDAQTRAAAAESAALRYRIASQFQIDAATAELLLTGSDEDTMTKQAERLAASLTPTTSPPRPNPAQGAGGGGPTSPEAAFAALMEDIL